MMNIDFDLYPVQYIEHYQFAFKVEGSLITAKGCCYDYDEFVYSKDFIAVRFRCYKNYDGFLDVKDFVDYDIFPRVSNEWVELCDTKVTGVDENGKSLYAEGDIQKCMEGDYIFEIFVGMDLHNWNEDTEGNEWTPRLRFEAEE